MKISGSSIAMSASRSYQKFTSVRISQITSSANSSSGSNKAASMSISDPSRKLLSNLEKEKKQREEAAANKSKGDIIITSPPEAEENNEDKIQLEALRKILDALQMLRKQSLFSNTTYNRSSLDILKLLQGKGDTDASNASSLQPPSRIRQTTVDTYSIEQESTSFDAQGVVKTSDGRELNFNINVEMSRSFEQQFSSVTKEAIISTFRDPLVINMDTDVASVSDQKFFFDIDSDGSNESISQLDAGSGYLALDKNGDGKINNGSELFGTASGDGFRDLAAYDKDGNNWIDENDEIFSKLRIWTKDKEGNDKLINLFEAGIGALYVRSVDTEFSLNNLETNQTNAAIRKSGIYLKESGEAGTMQHVDLAL